MVMLLRNYVPSSWDDVSKANVPVAANIAEMAVMDEWRRLHFGCVSSRQTENWQRERSKIAKKGMDKIGKSGRDIAQPKKSILNKQQQWLGFSAVDLSIARLEKFGIDISTDQTIFLSLPQMSICQSVDLKFWCKLAGGGEKTRGRECLLGGVRMER